MENKINTFQKGLNRDSQYLSEGEYDTLINGNFDSYDTSFILTNEMSNLLSSRFKQGFEVIHATNDTLSNTTYFFLVNETTGEGEFGQIKNLQTVNNLQDLPSECDTCGLTNDLATPLEEIEQVPLNTYQTLLSDTCKVNKKEGFNFSIAHPIKFSVIKNEKCGKVIYFTDDYNPFRYIKIDKISDYFIQNVPCTDDIELNCIDFDDLRVFKLHNFPTITPIEIQSGGRLEEGVYEFALAYTDEEGSEITEYTSITNPITIIDPNQVNKENQTDGSQTNYAIRLQVEGLDTNFSHYKIIVVQTLAKNLGVSSYFEEGVHTTDDNIVVYSGDSNKKTSSINTLTLKNVFLERVGMVGASNNTLFVGGLTFEKEDNLQPVVNFLGEFIQWQTHIATEDLYNDGINTSKFAGINRDEVVPYGIKFLYDGGYKSSIFPLIARQAIASDLIVLSDTNKDVQSINSFDDCTTTARTKKWQFYNTATVDSGFCGNDEIETTPVTETVEKICYIEDIDESLDQSITILLDEPYTNLLTYIEQVVENGDCTTAFAGTDLCELLDVTNYTETCGDNLFKNCYEVCEGEDCYEVCEDEDFCTTPELLESTIEITSIEGVTEVFTEVGFPEDYSKLKSPDYCNLYTRSADKGEYIQDNEFEVLYMFWEEDGGDLFFDKALFRDYNFSNITCASADEILEYSDSNSYYQGYFHNYIGAVEIEDLQTNKNAFEDISNPKALFTDKIHKDVLWYKGLTLNRDVFILELTKFKIINGADDILTGNANPQQKVRISVFNKCGDTDPIFSEILDLRTAGKQYRIEVLEDSIIVDNATTIETYTLTNPFSGGVFYVAIDTPLVATSGITSYDEPKDNTIIDKYRSAPPEACYGIVLRNVQYSEVTVTWERITTRKKSIYEATCTYDQPIVQDCTAVPYKKGNFAYWESTEEYPDNNELFNSSNIEIAPNDIPLEFRSKFENKFVQSNTGGKYNWKTSLKRENSDPEPVTDFTCRPIRHFKFPDNSKSPFIYNNKQAPFSGSLIFPLGITIPETLINSFLDIAVKNNLISAERRNKIVGYEIVRGDLSKNRSIVASGLLYDYRKYKEKNKDIYYSNYPFNDLGADKLNLDSSGTPINHPYLGKANDKFSFHSPETDYFKVPSTSEMSVQGYMYGTSRGNFDEVEGHSKWVILSPKAKDTANLLAALETATEVAVNVAQSAEAWRVGGGLYFTANPVGIGLNIASAALSAISSVLANFGRYRYEWLKAFRDLGQPQNFAYYYYAEGKYNYLNTIQEEGNKLRALQVAKYIREGNATTTNRVTGEIVSINNIDRERSMFISLGENNKLEYPASYVNYDNNKSDFNKSSLTFSSESNLCETGKSSEIQKNVASPYVALKNYIPSQYGTINSINWLSTGYQGDLKNVKQGCLSIFGGDTLINRHTLKRKIPLFVSDATYLPDLIPFNYKFYSNIGKNPRFYVDYEVLTNFSRGSATLPDIDYDLRFDCSSRSGNYYRPPSKFYLYYYGVPSFLTETRINTVARTAGKEPKDDFYPNYGDLNRLTQEKRVSIRTQEKFNYNSVYSKTGLSLGSRTLPTNYKKSEFNCRADAENGVMYSLPDNTENNYTDPWTIFRPNNRYEFPTSWGRLISIKGIENEEVLVRLTDSTAIFNSVDTTVDDGTPAEIQNLGSGGVFARRPRTFQATELGYGGTQSHQSISTEFGHFHVDAKRGQVIQVNGGKGGMQEISSFIDGKPSGMRNWFKEQLPFKILNYFPNLDVDNPYNGVGISMGYDSRFKRLFITKKDYLPIGKCKSCENDNLVVNGSLTSNLNGWDNSEEGYTWNAGKMWNTDSADVSPKIKQNILTVGKTYKITFDLFINPNCQETFSEETPIKFVKVFTGTTESDYIIEEGSTTQSLILTCTGNSTFALQTGFSCAADIGYLYNSVGIDNVCVVEFEPSPLCCLEEVDGQLFYNVTECEDVDTTPTCQTGYTFNSESQMCERTTVSSLCPISYTYNESNGQCELSLDNCESDIVFVMDNSSSINSTEIEQLNDFVAQVVTGIEDVILNGNTKVGVIKFAEEGVIKTALSSNLTTINDAIYSTRSAGSTNVNDGLCKAEQVLNGVGSRDNALKKIILVVDGSQNASSSTPCGTPNTVQGSLTFAKQLKDAGVNITLVVLGSEVERSLVKIRYGGEDGTGYTDYPLPSIGTGLYGYATYEAEFETVGAIVDSITNQLGCTSTVPAIPCDEPNVEQGTCTTLEQVEPTYVQTTVPADYSDETLFKDVSWTIAFSLVERKWIGWYDYKPNYYIAHQNYFQTGIRGGGLWSHLLTNKSYQVFYGELKPFEIIYKSQYGIQNSTLKNIKIEADVLRYHNLYDYAFIDDKFFTKATIFTNGMNTGVLNLVNNTGQMNLISKYPITAPDGNSQSILYSKTDNKYSLNYFYNRSLRSGTNTPNMLYDDMAIRRRVNTNFVKFGGKKTLEFIRGGFYYIQLKQDVESRLRFNLNIGIIQEDKI